MRAVAKEADERKLLVGAVDVDSGDAVIFDLTEMASKAVDPKYSRTDQERFRACYVEAIIASASEPLAAPPAFIDNREYIDGGARYGLFLTGLGKTAGLRSGYHAPTVVLNGLDDAAPSTTAVSDDKKLPVPPDIYLLVNGTRVIAPHCGKLSGGGGACRPDGTDPSDNFQGAHDKWDLLGLAGRSSGILINQIYRFSVSDVFSRYEATYGNAAEHVLYMPMIPSELASFPTASKNCAAQKREDVLRLRPLEFHPSYMRCLIAYGEDYAAQRSQALIGRRPAVLPNLRKALEAAPLDPAMGTGR